VIMGDSAGGGLAVSLVAYLKYLGVDGSNTFGYKPKGIPVGMPRCLVLISPWADLSLESKSWVDNSTSDFVFCLGGFFNVLCFDLIW
jgi:acetyl esterase/lipase